MEKNIIQYILTSLNNHFSKYTNKKIIVSDYEYLNTNYPISNFIIESLNLILHYQKK